MRTTPAILLPAIILLFIAASFTAEAKDMKVRYSISTIDSLPQKDTALQEVDMMFFTKVEVEASFPGGEKGWLDFIGNTLKAQVPAKRKAPVGEYTVVVQFIVDMDGKVTDIKALTAHGYGMEEEVIRVIRKSPRWTPASQEGRKVRAYRKQPVTFVVSER